MGLPPDPPENVRLVDPLGNEWPCDVVYEGFVDGTHQWRATPTHISAAFDANWQVRVSLLPGDTAVTLDLGGEEEPGS